MSLQPPPSHVLHFEASLICTALHSSPTAVTFFKCSANDVGCYFLRMPRHSAVQPCARQMVRWHHTQDSGIVLIWQHLGIRYFDEQTRTSKVWSPLPLQRLSSMPRSMKSRWKLGWKRDQSTQLKLFCASTSSPAHTSSPRRGPG